MAFVVGQALEWLAERLHPSGDAAIRGLEQDLTRETTLEGGWWRVCETAWALGFVELRLVPTPDIAGALAELHEFAPRPWPMRQTEDGRTLAQSTWAFNVVSRGRSLATLTARRRLARIDFEPLQFVGVIQGLLDRFVVARSTDFAASAAGRPARGPEPRLQLVESAAGPVAAPPGIDS